MAGLEQRASGWGRGAVVGGKDLTKSGRRGVRGGRADGTWDGDSANKLVFVNRKEVSIDCRVEVLLNADSPAIAQVGLIATTGGKRR